MATKLHWIRHRAACVPLLRSAWHQLKGLLPVLSPGGGTESAGADSSCNSAWEFEKSWQRFTHADLLGAPADTGHDGIRSKAIDDACCVLSSPMFGRQSVERRVQLLDAIHASLMSVPSSDLMVVADLGLRRMRQMLHEVELTEPQACTLYDALHSLYFAGASDVCNLRRFDSIVPEFEAWLEQRHGRHERAPVKATRGRPLTIAYFLHVAHFDRGNAVAPLICSLAEMHAARDDRRILLYALQHVGENFVDEMTARGVTVRAFHQGYRFERIDEVADSLRSDAVDIAVSEQNRSIAASLFVRRVAARQIWIDTGFPFWSLRALDWTVSPFAEAVPSTATRTSLIRWSQRASTLGAPVDSEAVRRVRSEFPPDAFVLGVFVRLIKLDAGYLDFLHRLLAADPRFHLIIAGTGDTGQVEKFVKNPEIAARVKFIPGNVDLNVYGQAIDLMCDTFPFVGGNACREVDVHGTPVVSKLGTPFDGLLKNDRNPDLLVQSEEQYIALVQRLARDDAFREIQRRVTLEKASVYCDPVPMLGDIEAAIVASIADRGSG